VPDLDLRPARRDQIAARLRDALEALIPGSAASPLGSLAAGTADSYSDIDLCWTVADDTFQAAVSAAAGLSARLPSVRAVRIDPRLARSDRRRLIFIRLAEVPLFWRVDLDIHAMSVAADFSYDDGNPAAYDETGWSRPASAIENAAAAIKSSLRGRTDVTDGLLSRGYERIGLAPAPHADVTELIIRLAESCARLEPALTSMASEVREVAETLLGP
jgi:predicted nucleotidyltransferase